MDAPQLIRTLVGFDTISRDSNLPLIEFVENYLDDQGIRSRRVPSPDGAKSNLVIAQYDYLIAQATLDQALGR